MKEKHSGINKNDKNKIRALFALLVAAAFILPTGAIFATDPEPVVGPDVNDFSPATQHGFAKELPADEKEFRDLETGNIIGSSPISDEGGTSTDSRADVWLRYDNGVNSNALGLTAGGYMEWAIRLTPTELAGYDGWQIETVQFCHGWISGTAQPSHDMTITIYEAGTSSAPGDVITTEEFTAPAGNAWHDVDLTNPVTIDETEDIWVTVGCQHNSGEYPAGMNSGVSVSGKGGFIEYGSGWIETSGTYGYTFNIAAGIAEGQTGPDSEYEWNAVVKYIYIEEEVWNPDIGDYQIVPKIIHADHEQACKNEYIHNWTEDWIDQFAPNGSIRCNNFPPGEHYIGAEIGNHGNNTYYNLPVHLNVWKQIYDEVLVSDFESHVFSDWVAIDGVGCVHPYPDGDTWNLSTNRYHSAGSSMHVSKTASYMKGANDTLRNRYPLNMLGGDCGEISFWFWVQGERDRYAGGRGKAYDYLQVFWINRLTNGTELRYGPLDVEVVEPGPVWRWYYQRDDPSWGGTHGQPMCYNSGGYQSESVQPPIWSKGIIQIEDEWKSDQNFVEFVWVSDCMVQREGAYIDDVVISRVINQGEKVYTAHEQVTLAPGEQKFVRFSPPWGECCPIEHGKYWIECRVKTHSNFVPDEEPLDDWLKDEVIISCHHDVGVWDVAVWPHKQAAGDVFSHLIPTNVSFTVYNPSPYDDEFDVKMTVNNMEYETIFFDDFEGMGFSWDHAAWEGSDLWHKSTRDSVSPTHSLAFTEDDIGFYDNNCEVYIYNTIDFNGYKDATLCFDAKWSVAPGDGWYFFVLDPNSFIFGVPEYSPTELYDLTGISEYLVSGGWMPEFDGHPVWVGPKNPINDYYQTDYGYTDFCINLKAAVDYWNSVGNTNYLCDFFGPPGQPNYDIGFGWIFYSDGSGRENPDNVEKWSGLYIDNVEIIGTKAGDVVAERTWHVKLPGQNSTQTIETQYCWDGIWGDFEIDIETFLETDCNPDNNWMDGYNHIYYVDWLDDVEDYSYFDLHPYEGGWTHIDMRQQGDSHWHTVQNIDPVEGMQDYWWCGIEGDTVYGENWNDCMISPEFDLYSLIPRSHCRDPAVNLSFRMCTHLSTGDNFYVEASNDSGRNWHILAEWNGPWQSNCWHDFEITIPLHMYTKGFMFRFRFESDGDGVVNKGVLLDDIILQALKGQDCTEGGYYGDPLAWYFEDDAETGGNPLWTLVPDYGGDLWHPYCYPIYHDPVYGQFGQIVSPILEACPDENYLPISEPWVLPAYDGEHFWMCEKHHKEPYDDGITVWPYCSYTYLNNMDNLLISPELDLQGTYHAHIWFVLKGALGPGKNPITGTDYFNVMIREKNDDGTWGPWNIMQDLIDPLAWYGFYNTDWDIINQLEDYYGTAQKTAATPLFYLNLRPYVEDQAIIQLAFRLISDEAGVDAGIKIDHIELDVKRDDVAPVTTCFIQGTMGCNNWYTSDVAVTLAGTDDFSGIEKTWYRIDGGSWQLYNERIQVSADGQHTIEYYSVDRVGNQEEIKTCETFKIDQTNPTVALSMPESGYLYIGGRPIFQIGRTIVIGDLTSQASASDATSGIDYVEFLVDGEVVSADLSAPFTFDLPFSLLPSSHTLQVKAYDNACNQATGTQTTYLKWL